MISSVEYSPFLTWKETDPITADSVSAVFLTLVSMVRDDYKFDEELLRQCSTFFSLIINNFGLVLNFNAFLKAIGQDSTNTAAVDALTLLRPCVVKCSKPTCMAFISSKLLPRMLSTPHLRDLSEIDDQSILSNMMEILQAGVVLATEDTILSLSTTSDIFPQSIRDLVLNEVLIPMEPSLVQIKRQKVLLSWNEEYQQALNLLINIFKVSAFDQPTLDFVCTSHIPIVFQSLISKVKHEPTHQLGDSK
ncbi:hypothetical protein BLNAU_15847 [Blattamonas nauphoetae]|uniref:Uncharacterized protein n=1 Tax=Blattamonas nauphoetae TaxID=2049346 RepID=A0ABQ9XCY8_9EUKA|nr:hypothetical protein BLNAU_15847 [Blattamonas nauphoetae]